VLEAIDAAGGEPRVLATGPVDGDLHCPVTVDDRPLTEAVNAALGARLGGGENDVDGAADRVAVVMADLALATPDALRELFAAGREADVAIAPGRGGGTNAFVAGHPEFQTNYHGASYLDHRRIAEEIGASVAVVDSHRLATDVDERADLVELPLHGECAAVEWPRDAGFEIRATDGRVDVRRE
jgi:2-phospho-L-lactate guanylyltransferase